MLDFTIGQKRVEAAFAAIHAIEGHHHNIDPLAIGAVQHLDDHRFPHARCWFSLAPRG